MLAFSFLDWAIKLNVCGVIGVNDLVTYCLNVKAAETMSTVFPVYSFGPQTKRKQFKKGCTICFVISTVVDDIRFPPCCGRCLYNKSNHFTYLVIQVHKLWFMHT